MAEEVEAKTTNSLLTCNICSILITTEDPVFLYGEATVSRGTSEPVYCCEACATALGGGTVVLPSARCRECSRPLSTNEPGQLNVWTGGADPRVELCDPCATRFGNEARIEGVESMLDIVDRLDDI